MIIDRRIAYFSLSVNETTSMKLSPYWGVKYTAKCRQRCAFSGLKCLLIGFRKMRAPSHHTSPLFATKNSAV